MACFRDFSLSTGGIGREWQKEGRFGRQEMGNGHYSGLYLIHLSFNGELMDHSPTHFVGRASNHARTTWTGVAMHPVVQLHKWLVPCHLNIMHYALCTFLECTCIQRLFRLSLDAFQDLCNNILCI